MGCARSEVRDQKSIRPPGRKKALRVPLPPERRWKLDHLSIRWRTVRDHRQRRAFPLGGLQSHAGIGLPGVPFDQEVAGHQDHAGAEQRKSRADKITIIIHPTNQTCAPGEGGRPTCRAREWHSKNSTARVDQIGTKASGFKRLSASEKGAGLSLPISACNIQVGTRRFSNSKCVHRPESVWVPSSGSASEAGGDSDHLPRLRIWT